MLGLTIGYNYGVDVGYDIASEPCPGPVIIEDNNSVKAQELCLFVRYLNQEGWIETNNLENLTEQMKSEENTSSEDVKAGMLRTLSCLETGL